MKAEEKTNLQNTAHTIRALGIDAIEKARSGHPGMVLGAAELITCLYAKILRHDPKDPEWMGRDRFVLSAGHGSMLLYGILHLCGYALSLDDIRAFRQLHSATPGHPEHTETAGVEMTTGPLGQGVASAVGMAIAGKLAQARFGPELMGDLTIWALAGDGCLMEGITAEAGSLAGTLGLDNLVLLYDSNGVCLDGPTDEVFREDVAARYRAYGFEILETDGYDWDQMEQVLGTARSSDRPTLVIVHTVIGKYSPATQGTMKGHGGALGPDDVRAVKRNIGWPEDQEFVVPQEVRDYFAHAQTRWSSERHLWLGRLGALPESQRLLWDKHTGKKLPDDFADTIWKTPVAPNQAGRNMSETVINTVARLLPWIISSSADVSSCDMTWLKHSGIVTADDWNQQQIKSGVREFCMAAAATGIQLFGLFEPVIGTFLTFSDYMRGAMRMAAMMRQRVIFLFSHDSVLIGEDGPSHQPVEHIMSLRLVPNLTVIRCGDENETKAAYIEALRLSGGPVVLCVAKQHISSTVSDLTADRAREGLGRGAYILYGDEKPCEILIIATGAEIHPAVAAARILESAGHTVRVVSMPSWELFHRQSEAYKDSVLGGEPLVRVSVEAGATLGWERYIGRGGLAVGVDTFGFSAPEGVLADLFGLTAESIAERISKRLAKGVNHAI